MRSESRASAVNAVRATTGTPMVAPREAENPPGIRPAPSLDVIGPSLDQHAAIGRKRRSFRPETAHARACAAPARARGSNARAISMMASAVTTVARAGPMIARAFSVRAQTGAGRARASLFGARAMATTARARAVVRFLDVQLGCNATSHRARWQVATDPKRAEPVRRQRFRFRRGETRSRGAQ